jgi:hypothetical protein
MDLTDHHNLRFQIFDKNSYETNSENDFEKLL